MSPVLCGLLRLTSWLIRVWTCLIYLVMRLMLPTICLLVRPGLLTRFADLLISRTGRRLVCRRVCRGTSRIRPFTRTSGVAGLKFMHVAIGLVLRRVDSVLRLAVRVTSL